MLANSLILLFIQQSVLLLLQCSLVPYGTFLRPQHIHAECYDSCLHNNNQKTL